MGEVAAIDLFCGAGGLSLGLKQAGIDVVAGIDLDPACAYPYAVNLDAEFILASVAEVTKEDLERLWPQGKLRLLAGCAPCQPFSSHRRGADTSDEENWDLLGHFTRLVEETLPDFVTMENVPRLKKMSVFASFVAKLEALNYSVAHEVVYGPNYGLPQERRRLVLLATRVGTLVKPMQPTGAVSFATVRESIGSLPALRSGESDSVDSLHAARQLSPLNMERIRASKPGGTWRDWPERLVAECHKRVSGASFQAFYGRMEWDKPSPTITTQSFNYGTGRFGHPDQDRTLTLREAAMLQGFPRDYVFVEPGKRPSMQSVGRLIGNAVPPAFGKAVGSQIMALTAAGDHYVA
ncbi:putative BsuMI modification methylase subunit YdiO [Clavibacter michiganensis]|uniref:DNA (cytosine-5-)-methyltransferase n=2 Tax=Clavibacter michiganensis TaxID=28447 RepID=A0A251YUE9_9MICO|nr:putative BsuMI modification methylase subunit YdiO [Clavibacter michiganensis]